MRSISALRSRVGFALVFLGDYLGNEISRRTDFALFVNAYDDRTNPHHYQQQVVATISVP